MKAHTIVGILALVAPWAAHAQQQGGAASPPAPAPAEVTEPKLPENPKEPTDFQAPVNAPGMPAPAGGGAIGGSTSSLEASDLGSSDSSATPGGKAPSGIEGGDMIVGGGNPAYYGGRAAAPHVPEFHLVQKKDTLWGICNHYYGDPWAWPQVWAHNRSITNPHWIYPGDKVRLLGGPTGTRQGTGQRREEVRVVQRGGGPVGVIELRQNAFADPDEVDKSGEIVGSSQERLMLSAHDEVYIEGNDRFRPQKGQSYSIYKVGRKLKDSGGKGLGFIVEVLGTVQIKSVNEKNVATGVITESVNPMDRYDRVGPLRRRFVQVAPRPAQKDLEAEVIATFHGTKFVAGEDLVFVDRGRNQGVDPGNRFLVVRRGDGYRRLLQDQDDVNSKFPQETVAELTVLDARNETSVCLITRAMKEVRAGDRLRMRRGY